MVVAEVAHFLGRSFAHLIVYVGLDMIVRIVQVALVADPVAGDRKSEKESFEEHVLDFL